ncbi:MAG: hypothetical protein ACOVNQ_04720, partial [Pirellula sp.]
MLSRFPNWVRSGLLLAMLAGTQTGCQTWKSPSFNMFPWSKKPSADKIVGTKPPTNLPTSSSSGVTSLAQDPSKSGGPVSPATRNTPSPVPGTPTPNTNLASNPPGAIPSPGTAAANNGFTPGTYNVAQPRTTPAAPNNFAANPNGSNPYAAMPPTTQPNGAVPSGALPNGFTPNGSIPNGSMSGASLPGTVTNTNPYGLAQAPVGQAGTMSQAPSNNNPYGSTLPPGGSGIRSAVYGPVTLPNNNSQNNIPNLPPAYGGPANSIPVSGIPVSGTPSFGNPGLAPQGVPQGIPLGVP